MPIMRRLSGRSTSLPPRSLPILAQLEERVQKTLKPEEAYKMVPGRDPGNG